MKLVKPKVEYLPQAEGLEGVYKQIEIAGRTCYKSTDKITDESAKPFVERMINSKHLAMLEHGTVYLKMPEGFYDENLEHDYSDYMHNKYSRVHMTYEEDNGGTSYANISTSLRVLVENNWLNDLQFICTPTEYHERRFTYRIVTSIGITRELIRHRVFSFANESTRYCNYSKDKFNNELTFIIPSWFTSHISRPFYFGNNVYVDNKPLKKEEFFIKSIAYSEEAYKNAISNGYTPQEAREVLPMCTKSEIIMTGFKSDWEDFLDKRLKGTTGAPHPDMKLIAAEIEKQLNLKE